jgi:hypothetical protein
LVASPWCKETELPRGCLDGLVSQGIEILR